MTRSRAGFVLIALAATAAWTPSEAAFGGRRFARRQAVCQPAVVFYHPAYPSCPPVYSPCPPACPPLLAGGQPGTAPADPNADDPDPTLPQAPAKVAAVPVVSDTVDADEQVTVRHFDDEPETPTTPPTPQPNP